MATSPSESLDDILVIEREIGEMLDRERSKAALWLDAAKKSIDDAAQSDLARLNESIARDQDEARKTAARNAAAIVGNANTLAARLAEVDDERLTPIVRKHIAAVTAGGQS